MSCVERRQSCPRISNQTATDLVPVFLHASFGSLWESLYSIESVFTFLTLDRIFRLRLGKLVPLQSHSSCYQHPSCASASIPQPVSTVYLFDSSWPLALAMKYLPPQPSVPHCLLAPQHRRWSSPYLLMAGLGSQICVFGSR